MALQEVVKGLYRITPVPGVNAYLFDSDGLTVIDTAIAGSAPKILRAVAEIGRQPSDVARIVVTHCHPDHYGSLAELKRLTGAPALMHPVDAAEVRQGTTGRRFQPSPGVIPFLLVAAMGGRQPKMERAEVEQEIHDGEQLPGGLGVVHAPGHSDGHIALLWSQHGGVLLAADSCWNLFARLSLMPFYVDVDEGRRSLARLSALDFEVACFGHGPPIRRGAAARLRAKWA